MNNLVDEMFDKNKNFQMGIFCTYSMNLDFFEKYLLNLSGVESCSNLCVFTDRVVYNNFFNINTSSKPKWINRRYLVIPIDTKGVFHPKLYLLASEKTVIIGIGSANLTRAGLASNLEIVSVFEVTEKDRTYSNFLKECLQFLQDVAAVSQSSSAIESVNRFINFTSHLIPEGKKSPIQLLNNLKNPILPKVIKTLKYRQVKCIKVISRFYDKNLKVHKLLENTYPKADFEIYIQQGKSNFPVDNFNFNKDKTKLYLYKGQDRYIHGKAIIFETEKDDYLLTGSTNYTENALLTSRLKANIETAILGEISSEMSKILCMPKGITASKLQNIQHLMVTNTEDAEQIDEYSISNWLIEVLYDDNHLEITINENGCLIPQYVIINDDVDSRISYSSIIDINGINKSDLSYVYLQGIDSENKFVESSKVWIINLDKERKPSGKKRFHINDPAEITSDLLELIKNGSEQDLIEYLLKFDIPLDIAGSNFKSKALRAMESKGNVFGELIQQSKSIFKYPGVFEAAKQFLYKNLDKLFAHYNNLQLDKLDNFMLIYGTIFNMMEVLNDYIVEGHDKNLIEAGDWTVMREYYDLMLECIAKIMSLMWESDKDISFEELVNKAIKKDSQKMLGSITSFKNFIVTRDYEYQYKLTLSISRKIIMQVDEYIEYAKVRTVKGNLVKAFVAQNGMKDNFIIQRKNILKLINKRINDFENWTSHVSDMTAEE